jgi:hypothetical protein
LHLADDIWTSAQYKVLPGAETILSRLVEAGVIVGLVSGAMEGAARTKLMPANLNRFFLFGAYGSDSADRGELTSLAVAKAARLHDTLTSDRPVAGDTPAISTPPKRRRCLSEWAGHSRPTSYLRRGGIRSSLEQAFPGL